MTSDVEPSPAPVLRGRIDLATGPAVVTLAVTIARLVAELKGAPSWLASSAPGGDRALLGIAWLPPIFGIWFAWKIAPALATTGARLKRLLSTLVVYGYLARVPVLLLFFLDHAFGWHTHYANFGDRGPSEFWRQAAVAAGSQLIFWPLIFTVIAGALPGSVVFLLRRPVVQPA